MDQGIEQGQGFWAGIFSFIWKAALTIGSSAWVSEVFQWGFQGFATLISMVICYLLFNRAKNYLREVSKKYLWLKEWLHKPSEGEDQTGI